MMCQVFIMHFSYGKEKQSIVINSLMDKFTIFLVQSK